MGTSLANHRASLSSELGSIWDFFKTDRDRRRSTTVGTAYEPIQTESKSPVRLARDLLQVVQETVFAKKFDEPKKCPLVKQESDLSEEEEGTEKRIANLIDFFFTIVKSQKEDRKGSGGSCFKAEVSPQEESKQVPNKVNKELEDKLETLMEFLATTGCMENGDDDRKDCKKITLMEFLFGPDDIKAMVEIKEPDQAISLSESKVNVKLSYIDETPEEERTETLVEMLLEYMENYNQKDKYDHVKSISVTPSLSEKSKSDITISKLETISDFSKTKSDSTLTHTQETVIDRCDDLKSDKSSRRISETVIDLSNIKEDLESIFDEAVRKIEEIKQIFDDTMSEQEDLENFQCYTKPPLLQYLPYSVELSDIMEEDEPSSRDRKSCEDPFAIVRQCAEELLQYIEDKVDKHFDDSEFDITPSLKRSSISLIDLRFIPDLPPSMIIKPKVKRVDKSTSTSEISDSISDLSRRIDSACMTEDTTLTSSSERSERALDKLESLHKFFSRSRLEIIDESIEEIGEKVKSPNKEQEVFTDRNTNYKLGQTSLDDVEDLLEDTDLDKIETYINVIENTGKTTDVDGINEIEGNNLTIKPDEDLKNKQFDGSIEIDAIKFDRNIDVIKECNVIKKNEEEVHVFADAEAKEMDKVVT